MCPLDERADLGSEVMLQEALQVTSQGGIIMRRNKSQLVHMLFLPKKKKTAK